MTGFAYMEHVFVRADNGFRCTAHPDDDGEPSYFCWDEVLTDEQAEEVERWFV